MNVRIQAGILVLLTAVTAISGAAQPAGGLLANSSFESPETEDAGPDQWDIYCEKAELIGIHKDEFHTGRQCLRISTLEKKDAAAGCFQTIPVEEGKEYTFSVYVKNLKMDPLKGTAYGHLVVEWKDEEGNEVKREWSTRMTPALSRVRWSNVSIRSTQAPKGAVEAVIGVHLYEGQNGGKGAILVDDLTARDS